MVPILLISVFLSGCNFSRPSLNQKVVLDVNGTQMTGQQFAQELAYRLKDQDALSAKDPKVVAFAKKKISEEFLVQSLTEEWSKQQNILIKAEELDEQIKQIQNNYPDDLAFKQAIAQEGISFKAWRDRLYNSLLQKRVEQKVVAGVAEPNESQLLAYYNEHKESFTIRESAQVRQLLVATESDAKSIEDELKRGKKMADLAKKYSISPEGPQGGNVGWLEKGLSDVFEPAFHMKVGRRSPVVKSAFGYHIFELAARKPARLKTFAEAKRDIQRIIVEKNEHSLYLAWLETQTRKARVFQDQTFIDALKVETRGQ